MGSQLMETMQETLLHVIFLEEDFGGLHYIKILSSVKHVMCVKNRATFQK